MPIIGVHGKVYQIKGYMFLINVRFLGFTFFS
jgi:hypothetical protein